ncbi:FAD-dependent oxidoreductase [Catelliglobosispora koreensis]|uniref:FAD-dependent oxidoreductase n=1 Tax=Catelliglobosispora koreensis TaxID=129052 RepID=UPI000476296B|nr:FAD-dependent oxidoreductase [Catelliglobosispora koreensis]
MTQTVVVVGGGYGGIAVAKALDEVADVILVEPRDSFVHNVAALRAVVDPQWTERMFVPYDGLLARGQIRQDKAVRVSASSVELASGEVINADYIVLATGSTVPFPAKMHTLASETAAAQLHALRGEMTKASHVLLLGAGPVGLEFAGEIKAAWPDKAVTIVDPMPELISGRFPEAFRAELTEQLRALDVSLVLGTSLKTLPSSEPGQAQAFTVTTASGVDIAADMWFPCYGAVVDSGYLDAELAKARQANGQLTVTPSLHVDGQSTVFAVGDLTAVPEMKMARHAGYHAEVVAANICALIEGTGDLKTYEPHADEIVLPLGPNGGVSYAEEFGVLGAETTAGIKSTFFIEQFRETLGIPVAA